MEDLGSIVWTLVLVGFGIYSVAQKRKKDAQKTPKQAHHEAWPTQAPWENDTDAESPVTIREIHADEPMKPEFEAGTDAEPKFDDESMYSEPETAPATHFTRATAMAFKSLTTASSNPVEKSPKAQTEQEQAVTSAVNTEETNFDLRKAVIYSEILKPKFDE